MKYPAITTRLSIALLLAGWCCGGLALAESSPLDRVSAVLCPAFATFATRYNKRFAKPMTTWSQAELTDLKGRPVLYLFSGPDVVTPLALFPDAPHLTLIADQKPEYGQLRAAVEEASGARERECRMLNFFSQLGYYRTDDLNGRGGERPSFIKLLTYSIAFSGGTITSASLLALNAQGELEVFAANSERAAQGIRFDVKRPDGRAVTVDYLVIDLANRGLMGHDAATAFLRRNAQDVLFLKSASHLLQSASFSMLANLLTTPAAPFVVQDETGLGVDRLEQAYRLTLYGHYTAPQTIWANKPAAQAFAGAYTQHETRGPLPFVFGYEKSAGSALLVGRRR